MRPFHVAFAAALLAPTLLAASPPADPAGDWVMHLYVEKHRFEDLLHLARAADGSYGGTLTVPNRFTVPLEKVDLSGDALRFDIVAKERGKSFRVHYDGRFDAKATVFVGLATIVEGNELLGGFVAQRGEQPLAAAPE